jgi:hypothetical protein
MNISKINEEMVKEKHMIANGSELCKKWKETHENCFGCESEIGCSKCAALGVLALQSMGYKPKDFEEHLRMQQHYADMMKKIMDAETAEEIKQLI